jgi:hypothetical protein
MDQIPKLPSDPARIAPSGARVPEPATNRHPGPAFEALLERLSARAVELRQRSQTLSSPAELPEAVDAARASLEDALVLGQELLEAYRAAQHGPGVRE